MQAMKLHRVAFGIVCASCVLPLRGEAQSLVAEYTFNDAGTSAANAVGGGTAMGLFDATGTAASTRTAGVSGQSGDFAFDGHDYSGGMGTTGAYGVVTGGAADFSGATSFTVTGWYNASSAIGSSARLFATSNVFVQFNSTQGLTLTVNGQTTGPTSTTLYSATNAWTFFAVSYDSVLSKASFYVGNSSSAVSLVATLSFAEGAVSAYTGTLFFGNRGSTSNGPNDRSFDGSLDDFRVYSGTFGAGAAADGGLDTVRLQALAVPEPGTLSVLSFAGLLGASWAWRRRLAVSP